MHKIQASSITLFILTNTCVITTILIMKILFWFANRWEFILHYIRKTKRYYNNISDLTHPFDANLRHLRLSSIYYVIITYVYHRYLKTSSLLTFFQIHQVSLEIILVVFRTFTWFAFSICPDIARGLFSI